MGVGRASIPVPYSSCMRLRRRGSMRERGSPSSRCAPCHRCRPAGSGGPSAARLSCANMSVMTVPQALVIEGGNPLNGRIRASGNKNGALPILAACLLADEPVTLSNVPRIRDVETMVELLCGTGASAEWTGPNEVRVDPQGLSSYEIDAVLAERIRASFLLAGPLLARLGRASVPPPGGDVIGRRRLDPHIHALQRLGAKIEIENRYEMETEGLRGAEIFLDEA